MDSRPIEHSGRNRAFDAFCILFIVVITILSWIPRRQGPIDLRWDAGTYYILGTSLAEGKGYRLLNEPGDIAAIQYPPLLPAIVAAHEMILRSSDPVVVGPWLRFTWFVLSVSSAIGCFLLARLFLPRCYALPLTLICVLSYEIFFVSTLCFAELPFSVATIFCVYLYYKPNRGWAAQAGVAITAIAAYLLRTVGIAMLAAWVADALFRRQFRTALVRACIALLPVLLWQSYIRSVESGQTYQHPYYSYQRAPWMFYNVSYATNVSLRSPFEPELGKASVQDLAGRFLENAITVPYNLGEALTSPTRFWKGYLERLNRFLAPAVFPWVLVNGLMCLLGFSVLAGIFLQLQQRLWLLGLYLGLTIAAVCMTPWPGQTLRYLSPAMPFLLIAVFQCVTTFEKWSRQAFRRKGKYLAAAVGACVALTVLFGALASSWNAYRHFLDTMTYQDRNGIKREYRLLHSPASFASMELAMHWLSGHAEPHSVVAVSMPHWVYLNTNLKTVMPPLEPNPSKAQRMLDSVPVSYLILEQMFMEHDFNQQFPSLVRNAPGKWQLVYSEQGVMIYKRTEVQAQWPGGLASPPGTGL